MRQSLIDHFDKTIGLGIGTNAVATVAVDALVEWLRDNHPDLVLDIVFKASSRDHILALADLLEAP